MAKGTEASIDLAERWLDRIKKREQDCATWYEDAARVYKRYRNEGETVKQGQTPKGRRFNVLWSNINVMRPALYAQAPKPEVERKHQDKDEVGRLAAQVLERAVLTSIQDDSFSDAMKMARDDRLMAARGQVWLQYVPTFGAPTAERLPVKSVNGAYQAEGDSKFKAKDAVVEDDMGEFTPGEEYTPVVSERVKIEFVHHKDFLHSDAPSWDLVTWVARRVWMTKRKIAKRFGGACAAHIDTKRQDARLKDDKTPRDTAPIWEIWDKDSGTVVWVCPDYKEGALDQQPDPMGLEGFFPCPRPVYGTLTPDSLIPVPDYTEYADQARELDLLTDRAYKLIEGIRVAGVYDSNAPGLAQLFNGTSGDKFVAVNNWAVFAEKGGLKSAMDQIDVSSIAESLQVILNVREQVKRDLYEVSGIADIMRGDTSPSETLGAQKLKASFGSSRMREPQAEMQRFVRDVVRIIAEIICEHFSPEQIADMAGAEALMKDQFAADPQMAMQTYMAAVQLLKEDRARGYRITIETDSTVELDAAQEKADRIEFLTAATGFLEKAAGMAQVAPSMTELMGEMLMWGMKAFRISRDLEKSFEKALGGIAQEQQQRAMQPPQPDPAIEQAKMDMQAKQAEMQASQQLEQAKMQAQQASEQAKLQADGALKQQEFDFKARELALKEQELQFKMQQHMDAQAFQREEFDRDGDMKSKEMAMAGRSKPSKDGGEGDDMGQSMPAITIQMPDDVAQILVQQRTAVSQSQIAAAQAEEAAALAEADAQRSLPQLLLEAAQAQRDTAQAFVVAAKVMAAPKKLVKTANGDKIAMPLLDGLVN
jgi:hypothetical protein